jgi:Na+-transporting NADH:ubiquinone oxidoreductase subunit NqrB
MLLIGVAIVPYWRSLEPLEFSQWFAAHATLIGRLMIPLGSLATLSVLLAASVAAVRRLPGWACLAVAAISAGFIAAIYPLYYSGANTALGSGTLAPAEITAELTRWRSWHWARIVAGVVAFLGAIRACSLQARGPAA